MAPSTSLISSKRNRSLPLAASSLRTLTGTDKRRAAGAARAPQETRRPTLRRPPHPAHRRGPAHGQAARTTDRAVAVEEHVEVEATRGIYQRTVAAYRHPDKSTAMQMMQDMINAIATGVPAALTELRRLGRTLKLRAADVLAFFDRPGTNTGPTEAINGRLEHLRGSALGFRKLTHYIARSLLEAAGFRPLLRPRLR